MPLSHQENVLYTRLCGGKILRRHEFLHRHGMAVSGEQIKQLRGKFHPDRDNRARAQVIGRRS